MTEEPTHLEYALSRLIKRLEGVVGKERPADIQAIADAYPGDNVGSWQFTHQELLILQYALDTALLVDNCAYCGVECGANCCQMCQ